MDYELMLADHVEQEADVTVGCIEVPRLQAKGLGVMAVDASDRITDFVEKPADPPGMPDNPEMALASMGIYVFATRFLFNELKRDLDDPNSQRDFGRDIIPHLVQKGNALAHHFSRSCVRSDAEKEAYWRDVGTVDAYWEANIDLTAVVPALDLYDRNWPIWTYGEITPPAKFVHDENGRRGMAVASLVSGGCIVSGAMLRRTLLFTGVHVHSHARVENAVILPDVDIGQGARLRDVIIEKGVRIPRGLVVGEDPVADDKHYRRTEKGICLITKAMIERLPA
jgi:glucose-1-phosphate adenylyltransferase